LHVSRAFVDSQARKCREAFFAMLTLDVFAKKVIPSP
jgi:hypothetical protein